MTAFLFEPRPQPSLPIIGDARRFPVRRILCVGQNYAAHAREMGSDPDKQTPFFFTKPGDAIVSDGANPSYPSATANLHYEAELVAAIGPGKDGGVAIVGWAVGCDLTRRDLQAAAKAARRPWDMAKGFDNSAVLGALVPGPLADAPIICTVDGRVTQSARISDMIWSVPEIIAHLSGYVALCPGDLIFTGTPAGVGPLLRGQTCTVRVGDLPPATVTLA